MAPELDPAVMRQVARRIFEEAAFLFSEDSPEDLEFSPPVLEATLGFEGPASGTLTLRAPELMSCEAAANLLGVEPDDEEAREGAGAAVGELLNMISGVLMKEWFGAKVQCSLGVPRVVRYTTAPAASRGPCAASFLVGECFRVEIEASVGAR